MIALSRLKLLPEGRRNEFLKKHGAETVLIRSYQHGVWWRESKCGYAYDQKDAGKYTFQEAFDATKHCGTDKEIAYQFLKTDYYYVSIKHTGKADPFFCIWQDNHSGYTPNLDFAGVYNEVYGNRCDTLSIPVERLRELSIRITGSGEKKITVVPNCQAVRDELGLRYKGRNLIEKK